MSVHDLLDMLMRGNSGARLRAIDGHWDLGGGIAAYLGEGDRIAGDLGYCFSRHLGGG